MLLNRLSGLTDEHCKNSFQMLAEFFNESVSHWSTFADLFWKSSEPHLFSEIRRLLLGQSAIVGRLFMIKGVITMPELTSRIQCRETRDADTDSWLWLIIRKNRRGQKPSFAPLYNYQLCLEMCNIPHLFPLCIPFLFQKMEKKMASCNVFKTVFGISPSQVQ